MHVEYQTRKAVVPGNGGRWAGVRCGVLWKLWYALEGLVGPNFWDISQIANKTSKVNIKVRVIFGLTKYILLVSLWL
jgi:hypothetical protein